MQITTSTLQNAQTTGNGATQGCTNFDDWAVYIRSNGTTSAGAVTLEEDMDGTATTWQTIATTPTSPVTVTGTNNVFALRPPPGMYGNVRARISTNVTGGTVTVTLIGRQW